MPMMVQLVEQLKMRVLKRDNWLVTVLECYWLAALQQNKQPSRVSLQPIRFFLYEVKNFSRVQLVCWSQVLRWWRHFTLNSVWTLWNKLLAKTRRKKYTHSLHVAVSFVLYLPNSRVLQFQESSLMTEVISVVNLLRDFMYLSAEVKVCVVTLFAGIFSSV